MTRHSFIRMSKLPDVQGRVDYISNSKRQEHLYAAYSTVEPEFWKYLSDQAQYDFRKSNQPVGKCIEARELIIALPESLTAVDPDLLLQLFTEKFREQYGVQCTAALHHNKAMTNYHIHLIFADRDILEKTEVKYASRNMFYDELGHHVRTKKEVLDENGNLRSGCRMIPKGEIYEMNYFSGRKEIFKFRQFLPEVKKMFTDLINQCVPREEDRQSVFDPSGPYLPTKKIGKNNPLADEIRADNELRQEWNRTVDQVLAAGADVEEVTEFKQDEVVMKVSCSVKEHGYEPGLFATLMHRALLVLAEFLELLMSQKNENSIGEEKAKETAKTQHIKPDIREKGNAKGPRPDSKKQELALQKVEPVYQKLNKANRKLYALNKQCSTLQLALDHTPARIFHSKDRKALQERIDGLQRQIALTQQQMDLIPKQHGYSSVWKIREAYDKAKKELDLIRRKQAEWDGEPAAPDRAEDEKPKPSVMKQLTEKQDQAARQQRKNSHSERKTEKESL